MTDAPITLDQLSHIFYAIGTGLSVEERAGMRIPAYLFGLDVGAPLLDEQQTQNNKAVYYSSAQLTTQHRIEELTGQQLLIVANFPRKQIGKMKSDALVTGVQNPRIPYEQRYQTTVAVGPSEAVAPGALVSITPGNHETVIQSNPRNLEWSLFTAAKVCVGTVIDASNPACLLVDYGPEGIIETLTNWPAAPDSLLRKQVLALMNLHHDDVFDCFGRKGRYGVILSPRKGVYLTPLKPVENGYGLA
ncbi:MAG: hypothetical protein KDK78_04080 [Chlamydiia bacterium]|nr:hypothetical protein [Chlamydiia bacterium]